MNIRLHANATTTPKQRAYIQQTSRSAAALAVAREFVCPDLSRSARARGIDHRLIKPHHSQTKGMIERFNGRLAKVLNHYRLEAGSD